MKIVFIYMASGFSRRFGENKLLTDFCGKPLYMYGLDCLLEVKKALEEGEYGKSGQSERESIFSAQLNESLEGENEGKFEIEILVVSQYEQIRRQAEKLGMKAVQNEKSEEGIAASLRLGTIAAGEDTNVFVYFVADQPYMRTDRIEAFVRGFVESKKGIGAVSFQGQKGNPAAFLRKYREELLLLCGDRGGSVIMRQHLDDLWLMEVPEEMVRDVDTREDLDEIKFLE